MAPSLIARARALAACAGVLLTTLSSGALASGVDPTRISLPAGPGSIEGLGRNFAPSLASGTASYGIDIAVPPGAGGFVPHVSLDYDSGDGVSDVGMGWRIGGIPSVRRSVENGLPRFTASDVYELTGFGVPGPLVQNAAGFYRPEFEPGTFVRAQQSAGGATWQVRDKAGVTYDFGASVESENGNIATWLLGQETDLHGHFVAYAWDTSSGHGVLQTITWNDYGSDARNVVTFNYETRPDPHTLYASGIKQTFAQRLTNIAVTHGGNLVRRYDLTYAVDVHSRLATVTLVGRDGLTREPALSFTYAAPTFTSGQVVTMAFAPGRGPGDPNVDLADLNGDSLPDLLVTYPGQFAAYVNQDGLSWQPEVQWSTSASPSVELSTTGVQLADLNGDGAIDLVVKSGTTAFRYFPGSTATTFAAPVPIATVPDFSFEDPDTQLGDMDSDRRIDVVETTADGIAIGYNVNGTDWTEPVLLGPVDPSQPLRFSDGGKTQLCDVNGDRVEDFCYLTAGTPGSLVWWPGRGRGVFDPPQVATGVPAFSVSSPWVLRDLNGDGWLDLVHVAGTEVDVALATAAGTFAPVRPITGMPEVNQNTTVRYADMNGNGTVDVVWIDVADDPATAWQYLELFPSGKAGLLTRIDNGLGHVTSIAYSTAAADAAAARTSGSPWTSRLNVGMPVVRTTSSDDSLGDAPIVTEYHYANGTFSPVERTFAGFAGGTETQDGDQYTPTLVTANTFDVGIADRTQRGLVLTQRRADTNGTIFDQTTDTYATNTIDNGTDGTPVVYTYKTAEQKTEIEGTNASAGRTTLTEWTQDVYGNVTNESRWGEVVGGNKLAGNDEAITLRTYAIDAGDWLVGFLASEELQDGQGNRVSMSRDFYDGADFTGLPLGQVSRGDVTRQDAWVGPDASAFQSVIATSYDGDGHALETRDARGGGHIFTWDAQDHTTLRSESVKLEGGLLTTQAQTDRAFGVLTSVTGYDGQTTALQYDSLGRLVAVVRPGDSPTSPTVNYTYLESAPLSRVITDARVWSGQSTFEHREDLVDGLGRKRGTLTLGDSNQWVLAGVSLLDARGGARKVLRARFVGQGEHDSPPLIVDAPGDITWRDALARAVGSQSLLGITTKTVFTPFTVSTWDGAQNDPSSPYEHTPVVKSNDGLGRLVTVTSTLGGASLAEAYTYDASGSLLSKTDPEGNTSSYGYDGRGRRTSVTDPDVGRHTFVYDPTGNQIEHDKPNGLIARNTFDLAGRPLTEDWDGDGTPDVISTWDVSPRHPGDALYAGKLVTMTDPSGTIEHEYDSRQRVVATHRTIGGKTFDEASTYDDRDREALHTFPDGSSLRLYFNPRGQVVGYGHALTISYDADGAELARSFNTGVVETPTYDADRRRVESRATTASGAVIQDLVWSYDDVGNVSGVVDQRQGIDSGHDRTESYALDNLYRLTGVTGAWGTASWSYSPSGNVLARTSTVAALNAGELGYGGSAGPHALTTFAGRTVRYDAAGRMTSDGDRSYTWSANDEITHVTAASGATLDSTYDGTRARRTRVERAADGATHTTYFLGPWSEVRDGQLVRFVVHNGKRVAELAAGNGAPNAAAILPLVGVSRGIEEDSPGQRSITHFALRFSSHCIAMALLAALLARYRKRVFSMATWAGAPIAVALALSSCGAPPTTSNLDGTIQTLSAADTLFFDDAIGTLTEESSGTGGPRATFASYPYGLTRFDTSSETQKYAGTPRDSSVALDQMGARSYASDLGVWTSGDPVAVDDPARGLGATFAANNPYVYAADRPVAGVDRDGHFFVLVIAAIVIGSLITAQFANAPESSTTPLVHESNADLALDTAHNSALIYGAATFGTGAVTTIANEGVAGAAQVGSNLITGTIAGTGVHALADAADPSGRLGKVADIAMVAQAHLETPGVGARVAPEGVRGAGPGRGSAGGPTSGKPVTKAARVRTLETNAAENPRGNYYCEHCGYENKDPTHIDTDHIVPRSEGGDLTPKNLRGLCQGCNRSSQEDWPPNEGSDWATKHSDWDMQRK